MINSSGIYAILNLVNGKRYIGGAVSLRTRGNEHRNDLRKADHHSPALQRAWNKYGEGSFVFKPLLICAPKDLLMYEQRCLDSYRPEYNCATVAGAPMTGRKHSAESRAKIASAGRGRKPSPEVRLRMSVAQRAWKRPRFSVEGRANMSAARRGIKRKPFTAEHRANIATANIGRKHTIEARSNMAASRVGHKRPDVSARMIGNTYAARV